MPLFTSPPARRPRLSFDSWPAAVYAIGDVHGCLDQLLALEAEIAADGAAISGEKWIITLGDHIDRGPSSRGVLEHLLAAPPPDGFRRFSLVGNHEQILLDFLDNPAAHLEWLEWGGLETAESYGMPDDSGQGWRREPLGYAAVLRPLLPATHLDLIRSLPTFVSLPGFVFVHAGIRPGVPLDRQEDEDLIWIRAPFLRGMLPKGLTVVHGHTPVEAPEFAPGRIDIDTGCFHSGVLTGLRVLPDGATKLLQVRGAPSSYRPAHER